MRYFIITWILISTELLLAFENTKILIDTMEALTYIKLK